MEVGGGPAHRVLAFDAGLADPVSPGSSWRPGRRVLRRGRVRLARPLTRPRADTMLVGNPVRYFAPAKGGAA